MPDYLRFLREVSVSSIYALFILILLLLFIKGKIKDKELAILFYVWLPIAVSTQFLMTYIRLTHGKSNLPIMNIYFIIEFILLVYILIKIREKEKNIKINNGIWITLVIIGIATHFFYPLDSIHGASILFMAVVYFQITIGFFDINEIDKLYKDPFSLLNVAVFIKAFGYSYFLIYQLDYKFPLIIYSIINLLVQVVFAIAALMYYKRQKDITV